MIQCDNIYAFPILHYKMEFASEVHRLFQEIKPTCVAVELPETQSEFFLRAAARLPDISVVVAQRDEIPLYTMCEPCDPLFAALRCAHEAQVDAFCIDLEVADYPEMMESFADPYAILQIGFQKYYELSKRSFGKKHPLDLKRESYMGRRLKELALLYEKVLFVGGFFHVEDALAESKKSTFPQLKAQRSEVALCTLTEEATRECMAEHGFNTLAFEEQKTLPDRQKLALKLYKSSEIKGLELKNTMKYARNLSLLKRHLTPHLYELLVAAKGCAGEPKAFEVYKKATDYPLRKNVDDLPELDLTIEEIWGASKLMNFRFKGKSRKSDSSFFYAPSPYTLCSYPKEDVLIEATCNTIKRKAVSKLKEIGTSSIPFTTSFEEGLDIRTTVRKWHEKKLYVKTASFDAKPPGTLVVIYDEDSAENYPWKMTWMGENDQESDMAFYSTHTHKNIVGPGMSKCEYGGFLMTSPPRRLMDIWDDSDYEEFDSKADLLLAAAIDYSLESHIVYVAKKPPNHKMKRFAAKFGKKIIYTPLGVVLNKVRTFHVLDGHDKRKIADEYIK